MSIFKTKWIILKINKIKNKEFLYTIFTKDYWKIKCNTKLSKNEKILDLWYLINFEIYTKENVSIHKIRNIKISSEFSYENKNFKQINLYLVILSIINKNTPDWTAIYELFELIEILNITLDNDEIKLNLIRLKIISILWELNEYNSDITISKILKFINSNKIEKILKLTWINEELKNKLETI